MPSSPRILYPNRDKLRPPSFSFRTASIMLAFTQDLEGMQVLRSIELCLSYIQDLPLQFTALVNFTTPSRSYTTLLYSTFQSCFGIQSLDSFPASDNVSIIASQLQRRNHSNQFFDSINYSTPRSCSTFTTISPLFLCDVSGTIVLLSPIVRAAMVEA